ncbi:MAG: single-stranded DNA-binding protein [Halobacteriovoraceae bacterium]|jgi:single-strand DNA-binding protein|nr:single-stranded DNA-binding protein [Halobacteriovoraceae bacterium]
MGKQKELYVGRLGSNPTLKYTKNQKAVCHLSVAVSQTVNQKPYWLKVVVWGKQAEDCNLYLKKGKEVFIQGFVDIKEYIDKDGVDRSYEEMTATLVGYPNN